MTGKDSIVVLELTPEERQQIEDLARRRGYNTPEAYLLALIEADALAARGVSSEDDDEFDIEASFRQGWHEAMTGQTRPISELWDALDDDE